MTDGEMSTNNLPVLPHSGSEMRQNSSPVPSCPANNPPLLSICICLLFLQKMLHGPEAGRPRPQRPLDSAAPGQGCKKSWCQCDVTRGQGEASPRDPRLPLNVPGSSSHLANLRRHNSNLEPPRALFWAASQDTPATLAPAQSPPHDRQAESVSWALPRSEGGPWTSKCFLPGGWSLNTVP